MLESLLEALFVALSCGAIAFAVVMGIVIIASKIDREDQTS